MSPIKLLRKLVYYVRMLHISREKMCKYSIDEFAIGSVLIPASTPGGAGDDAMVNGAIVALKKLYPDEPIAILVSDTVSADFCFSDGILHIRSYSSWKHPSHEAWVIRKYKRVFILGADILDGAYNLPDAVKRIKLARICREQGQDSRIVGFSINEKPHPRVISEFIKSKNVPLYLRDPVSFGRAKSFFGGDVHLSADVAFLLQPDFIDFEKEFLTNFHKIDKGNGVYGINIHSLLERFSSSAIFLQLIKNIVYLIEENRDIGFVLISHDYRQAVDDRVPLKVIFDSLSEEGKERVYFIEKKLRASQIKSVCKHLSGVLTGRMHLAIAALGANVPILGIVYQGKFEGTLSYFFSNNNNNLMAPEEAANKKILSNKFSALRLVGNDDKSVLSEKLANVINLSLSNFE